MTHDRQLDSLTLDRLGVRMTRAELAASLVVIILSSLAAFVAAEAFGEVAGALIFVLGITIAGAFGGLGGALLAALIAFLLYNFFLTEPVLTFRIATGRDIAPLVVFNLCALVTGLLAGRLKDRAQAADLSNRHLSSLLALSQSLQAAVSPEDVATVLRQSAPALLGTQAGLFSIRDGEPIPLSQHDVAQRAPSVASIALRSPQPLVHEQRLTALRLDGSQGAVGVMVADLSENTRDQTAFIAALGNLLALALERAALSAVLAESRAAARTEELKTALLSSVSHDLRTPLTAITASASSLIDFGEQLDGATSRRLLQQVIDESERLNRYTANLLEMSRLEAGQAPANLQTLDTAEVIAAAVQRARGRLGDRRVHRRFDTRELLVQADAALFELVLVNVLENAALYSEERSIVEIATSAADGFCQIDIADQGRGIPEAELGHVFERFYRVPMREPSPKGSGLGLAIAKGFVEALDGSIEAHIPGIGNQGTRISIKLPLAKETVPS